MNSILKMNGHSARRRAIDTLKTITSFFRQIIKKGNFLGVVLTVVLFSACENKNAAQTSAKEKNTSASVKPDSLSKPKVNIQVNKHYDDKGNLVGFDSTYSSFYSNIKGDTNRMDTLMHSFDHYFNRNRSSFLDKPFNSLFFNDSMRYPDFFHKDFFLKRYELNDSYMRGIMERMDSVKNQFYYEHSKKENNLKQSERGNKGS
jgi:hypothetical protein